MRRYCSVIAIGLVVRVLSVQADPIEIDELTAATNAFSLTIQSALGAHFEVYHNTTFTGMPWQIAVTGLVADQRYPISVGANARRGYFIVGNSDIDTDGDQLPDARERYVHQTAPHLMDTDNDDMSDGWEVRYGLQPRLDDGMADLDGDDLSNILEYEWLSNPSMPDTDGDGMLDGEDEAPAQVTYPLRVSSPTEGQTVYDRKVTVWGVGVVDPDSRYFANGSPLTDGYLEDFHGIIELTDGSQTVVVEMQIDGIPKARCTVNFVVDGEAPEFRLFAPTTTVSQENVLVVINADGSNLMGVVAGNPPIPMSRNGYLYYAWLHMPQSGNVSVSMTDTIGRSSEQTFAISVALPDDYSSVADSDGDGVPNGDDLFPDNPNEAEDGDRNGVGDNNDPELPEGGWILGPAVILSPAAGEWAQ